MSDFSAGNERNKKKTGEGNEASLAGLSEEERALILQMREAKEEEQEEEQEEDMEGVDSSDDEEDRQRSRWLRPPSNSKNTRIGSEYQAAVPSIGGN